MSLLTRLAQAQMGSRELDARRPCIFPTGYVDKLGRKRVWHGDKLWLLHRLLWTKARGPIPVGKKLCHDCDNSGCLELSHMYVGTQAENVRDMMERRRHWTVKNPGRASEVGRAAGSKNDWAKGEDNPKARLSREDVKAIAASTEKTAALATKYGVNRTTIQRVRGGVSWTR